MRAKVEEKYTNNLRMEEELHAEKNPNYIISIQAEESLSDGRKLLDMRPLELLLLVFSSRLQM